MANVVVWMHPLYDLFVGRSDEQHVIEKLRRLDSLEDIPEVFEEEDYTEGYPELCINQYKAAQRADRRYIMFPEEAKAVESAIGAGFRWFTQNVMRLPIETTKWVYEDDALHGSNRIKQTRSIFWDDPQISVFGDNMIGVVPLAYFIAQAFDRRVRLFGALCPGDCFTDGLEILEMYGVTEEMFESRVTVV